MKPISYEKWLEQFTEEELDEFDKDCDECDGDGEVCCDCCGYCHECDKCGGTGKMNTSREAYKQEVRAIAKIAKAWGVNIDF